MTDTQSNTKLSSEDRELISEIAQRASDMAHDAGVEYPTLDCMMDLESAHSQMPLELGALKDADDFNFAHDVFGIRSHMDRSQYPGKIVGHFVPRFTVKQ